MVNKSYTSEQVAFFLGLCGFKLLPEYVGQREYYKMGIDFGVIVERFNFSYENMRLAMKHYEMLVKEGVDVKSLDVLVVQYESILEGREKIRQINRTEFVKGNFFVRRVGAVLEDELDKLLDIRTKDLTGLDLGTSKDKTNFYK